MAELTQKERMKIKRHEMSNQDRHVGRGTTMKLPWATVWRLPVRKPSGVCSARTRSVCRAAPWVSSFRSL